MNPVVVNTANRLGPRIVNGLAFLLGKASVGGNRIMQWMSSRYSMWLGHRIATGTSQQAGRAFDLAIIMSDGRQAALTHQAVRAAQATQGVLSWGQQLTKAGIILGGAAAGTVATRSLYPYISGSQNTTYAPHPGNAQSPAPGVSPSQHRQQTQLWSGGTGLPAVPDPLLAKFGTKVSLDEALGFFVGSVMKQRSVNQAKFAIGYKMGKDHDPVFGLSVLLDQFASRVAYVALNAAHPKNEVKDLLLRIAQDYALLSSIRVGLTASLKASAATVKKLQAASKSGNAASKKKAIAALKKLEEALQGVKALLTVLGEFEKTGKATGLLYAIGEGASRVGANAMTSLYQVMSLANG